MEVKHPESPTLAGKVVVRSHPAGTIDRYHELAKTDIAAAQALLKQGTIELTQKNLIVSSLNLGFDILVQYLVSGFTGSFAFPLGIAWGEIGTGNATPSSSDTALTTPTNRTTVAYAADTGFNEAIVQFFFPDSTLANTTYYEFGTFVGGTSAIGDGNIFNHALFSTPYSKSAGVDTTCEVDFSFSNS
jgi:hypothetical protein